MDLATFLEEDLAVFVDFAVGGGDGDLEADRLEAPLLGFCGVGERECEREHVRDRGGERE